MSERAQPEPGAWGYLRLVLLGAVIGIPAALVASVFLALVHDVEHWLWHDLPHHLDESSPPWYLVIGLPVAGACLVAIARRFLPGDGGHSPLHGFAGKPPLLSYAPGVVLAAIGTLSFGAVLGPEGPLIALGAVVGILVTRLARLGAQESAVLGNAGSFAAISALFGGPIVGGVLMMEGAIGFGAATISILLPGFVAAGVGYVVFVGFGDWGGLHAQSISFTGLPEYTGVHVGDTGFAILVGVLTALVVVVVRRFAFSVSDREKRIGMPLLLILGGLAVGLLAQAATWLGADAENVLFSGQAAVPAVVAEDSAKIVLILLVAKALAYASLPWVRLPGRPRFPRHLPRRSAGDVPRDLVRRLADAGGRGRNGRRHGGCHPHAPDTDPLRRPARRTGRRRRRPGGGDRGGYSVARDRRTGAASQGAGSSCRGAGPGDGRLSGRSPGAAYAAVSLRSMSSSRPKRSSMMSSRASMRCSVSSSAIPRSSAARATKIDVITAMKTVTKATP